MPEATGAIIPQCLTRLAGEVKTGAQRLGFLTKHNDGTLTTRGQAVCAAARTLHGSPGTALRTFGEYKGSHERFLATEIPPQWTTVMQAVLATHPGIKTILRSVHVTGNGKNTLPRLVAELSSEYPAAVPMFITADSTPHDDVTSRFAAHADSRITEYPDWMLSTDTYRSATISHVKSLCCHAGLLTHPGATTDTHTPRTDEWGISPHAHTAIQPVIETPPDPDPATTVPAGDGR